MKIKIHEFKLIVPKPAANGSEDNGQYVISNDVLAIPETLLNQQTIVETLVDGVKGVNECCCRIYVNGSSWLVLGDVRAVCFTNDVVVAKY